MKNKRFLNRKTTGWFIACTVMLFIVGCVYLDDVSILQDHNGSQEPYAYAGDTALFVVRGHIEAIADIDNDRLVVAVLAPKGWDLGNNSRVTYKNDLAEDPNQELPMSAIPYSELPKNANGKHWPDALMDKFGVGSNVLDDMEWVAFQSNARYNIRSNMKPTFTVYIRTKVGMQNLKCYLGFFINHTDDGLSSDDRHWKVKFADEPFEVKGGTGALIDYCNNHFNKVTPMLSLQNDYLTFTFLGDVASNELINSDEIYFQGEAFTSSGNSYVVNEKSSKTLMKKDESSLNSYEITLWPVGFFDVPATEQIDSIHYYFTNKDESITIGQSDDDHVQLGDPLPETMVPFNFEFVCD